MSLPLTLAATALAVLTALTVPALAEGTSQDDVLRGDLLAGWQVKPGAHIAGLRLQLAKGWKTYWRSPGDAGIPPQFDWSASENLKSVRVLWPSPTVFHTAGFRTIGYKGGVVLPVEVVAQDPARPVVLRAAVELGVCRDICMPAWLELSVEVAPPGAPDAEISAALDARPDSAAEAGVRDVSCAVEPIADGLRVTADIAMPGASGEETVAFETDDPRVWVAESQARRQGDRLVAVTEMVGPSGAPFALDRSALVMTVISEAGAVEIRGCPAP
ncbi:MAG: hypothetical protein KBF78_13720 [Fuscovulum sp.]|nr:hypothetical protein [Fuscovulum sp.]